MKLAVRKEEGAIPGGGFHYMLHPMKMTSEFEAEMYRLMGYIIIEVPETIGEEYLDQARQALRHQLEIAHLAEKSLK
jgi:hypothetical protein